jgi:hypothetical protein
MLRKARGHTGREGEGGRRQDAAQEGKHKEPSPALPRRHHLTRCASRPARQSFPCQPSVVLPPFNHWVECERSQQKGSIRARVFLCHGREVDAPFLSQPCTNPAAERVLFGALDRQSASPFPPKKMPLPPHRCGRTHSGQQQSLFFSFAVLPLLGQLAN